MKTHQNRLELKWISAGLEGKLMSKSKTILSVCLIGISMLLSAQTQACPCPPCPPCHTLISGWPDCDCDYDCTGCASCLYGSCVSDNDLCPGCQSCVGWACTDIPSKCEYFSKCEDCINDQCVDRCVALNKHCDGSGNCVECRDILDCTGHICEECVNNECVHPCDDCNPPKYCASACACVECALEDQDTSTCNKENESCPDCRSCPSQSYKTYRNPEIYTSCTGDGCDEKQVLCYREWDCMNGEIMPLFLCGGDIQPPSCIVDIMSPIPTFCFPCVTDITDSGTPSYTTTKSCPAEIWPP